MGFDKDCIETDRAASTLSAELVIIAAQLTIGKSIDFLIANFRKALLAPLEGSGTWTSVTISSASRTVVPQHIHLEEVLGVDRSL